MTDSISFINTSWFWYVIGISIIVFAIFILKEWFQSRHKRFSIKLLIIFLGLFALSMIALKPALKEEVDISKLIILTKEYTASTLDSLETTYKNIRIKTYTKGQPIFDASNAPTSVFILGQGLAPFDLWQLHGLEITYLNKTAISGITRLKYKQDYTIGEQLIIDGLYQHPKKGHKLILEDPSGRAVDSINFSSEKTQPFQLSTSLNIKGHFTYSITQKDTLGNTLNSNALPLKVSEQNALRILVINGFPTFETKYLKNYLSEMGHAIVVRSQITKGRYKYEYFNMQNKPRTSLTKTNLEQFDLVIIDGNSLLNTSKTQRSNLENAIRDEGLGLLIQPTSRLFRASSNLIPFKFNTDRVSEIVFPKSRNVRVSKHPYWFTPNTLTQNIHNTETKNWSAFSHFGKGRIGTTVFKNTFELILNGKQKTYKTLWSDIITHVSKRKIKTIAWKQQNLFAFKDEPHYFKLRTNIETPEVKSGIGYRIPTQQNLNISSVWEGKTYPKTTGWQKLILKQDTTQTYTYYVNDSKQWEAFKTYETVQANTQYAQNSSSKAIVKTTQKPIHLIWFYILFLSCFTYLWLEPKL